MTPSSPNTSTPGSAESARQTPPWGAYERLRPDQIESIRADVPLAYVPWGALEWHSYHNPVGLDGLQALGQCRALAAETGGVVLPPFYVGTDTIKPFKGFGHTLDHRDATVRLLAEDLLVQLGDEGFRVVVIVTGHCGGGHVAALRAVVDAFDGEQNEMGVLLVPSFDPVQDVYPSNHAAFGETALQLLFDPDLVDLSRLSPGTPPTLDDDGVWGDDPRPATAEAGQAILDLFLGRTVPQIEMLLDRYAGREA